MTNQEQYNLTLSSNEAAALRALFAEKVKVEESFITRAENSAVLDGRLQPIIDHAKEQSAMFRKAYDALRRPVNV